MTFGGDDDDVRLGYKNPPPWSQFRKGQSGNPKGRPKKKPAPLTKAPDDSAFDDVMRDEMNRTVRVTDAKGSSELDMLEVIIRAQATAAAKGNVHAQREFLKEARALEVRDAARKAAEAQKRRDMFEYAVLWKKAQSELWATAARAGVEPAEPWPHPEDMFLNEAELKYSIRGPECEGDLPLFEYFRAERDSLFAQAILDSVDNNHRLAPALHDISLAFELRLPRRWQILDKKEAWDNLMLRNTRWLRAEVERRIERAAQLKKRANIPPPGRETYRFVNEIMKPGLKEHGYRSFAQFEMAYEETGGQI